MALREVMAAPDKGIPRDLFDKARCVIIAPDWLKDAFGIVVSTDVDSRPVIDAVTAGASPAAVAIEGASFGLQPTDRPPLVMNQDEVNRPLSDRFTPGGEASVTAGPVGRNTSADTDVLMRAEIASWSRSRGLLAGLSLEGAALRPDSGENRKLYGREITNQEILETGVAAPRGGRPLVTELDRYSGVETASVEGEPPKNRRVELVRQ